MNYISLELLPVLISLVVLMSVLLYTMIKLMRNWVVLFALIPLTLMTVIVMYRTIDDNLGYCTLGVIPDDAVYQSHVPTYDDEKIEARVYLIETEAERERSASRGARCYLIDNTEENQEAMEEAENKTEQGVPQQIKQKGDKSGQGQTQGGEYAVYDFQPRGDDFAK